MSIVPIDIESQKAKKTKPREKQQHKFGASPIMEDEFGYEEQELIATLMPSIDTVIKDCIDEIWMLYDANKDSRLSPEETRKFVKNTLIELGETGEFTDADLN